MTANAPRRHTSKRAVYTTTQQDGQMKTIITKDTTRINKTDNCDTTEHDTLHEHKHPNLRGLYVFARRWARAEEAEVARPWSKTWAPEEVEGSTRNGTCANSIIW